MIARLSVVVQKVPLTGGLGDESACYAYLVADTGITLYPEAAHLMGRGQTGREAVVDLFDQVNLDRLVSHTQDEERTDGHQS